MLSVDVLWVRLGVVLLVSVLSYGLAFGAEDAKAGEEKKAVALYNVSTAAELVQAVEKAAKVQGTVVIAPGDYTIDKTLEIKDSNCVNITGSGWNTVIRKSGAGDAIRFVNAGFCTVRNLLLAGDPKTGKGSGICYQGYSSSCTVDYVRICEFPESGIRYEGDPKSPMSTNTVSNCHFIGNRGHQLYSFNNNDFYIRGNQFGTHSAYPKTGCWLHQSSAGTYTMNYHWDNVNAFRLGPGSHYNRIENNRFEESREVDVIIGDPKTPWACMMNIITGNTFHSSSKDKSGECSAIEAYNAHSTTFCQNQVFSWNAASIKHKHSLVLGEGCGKWIVKDNIFAHNTDKALVYDEKAGHIVKDNLFGLHKP